MSNSIESGFKTIRNPSYIDNDQKAGFEQKAEMKITRPTRLAVQVRRLTRNYREFPVLFSPRSV